MREVVIENVGPVSRLEIPVPEEGGLVVLRGRNGAGKSESLQAVEALIRGRGGLSARDGAARGRVEGFGATLTVAKSTRRAGVLDCVSLEGRLNVASLVDPGIEDPLAADLVRVKSLVRLANAELTPTAFLAAFPAEHREHAASVLEGESDPVELAAKAKRVAERLAREEEKEAADCAAKAAALRAQAEGVREVTDTEEELHAGNKAAVMALSALEERQAAAVQAKRSILDARQRMEALRRVGAPLEQLRKQEAEIKGLRVAADARLQRLRGELAEAEKTWQLADADLRVVREQVASAEREERTRRECMEAIERAESEAASAPTAEDVQRARATVNEWQDRSADAAAWRKSQALLAKADELAAAQSCCEILAGSLRKAARSVDSVLSALAGAASERLRIEDGRVILDTRRGPTKFAELSHGERWRIALDVAIGAVGDGGIVVVPQEAWEGLDPINRSELAEHVRGRRVVVLTAEATGDNTLTAELA